MVRFFVTSRPYWDIEKGFDSLISDVPGIRLMGENQSESLCLEIDRVIKARVLELDKQFTGRAREQLLEGLQKVENRTYLWLHLVFEYIASKPRIDTKMAQNILRELPSTVEEAYEAILRKSKDQTQAKRLLHIIVAAVRPLSVIEVGIALYITEEMRSLEDLELQESEQLAATIRDLCGLFVRVIDGRVFLLRQIAKEFLIAQEGQNQESSILTHDRIWRHSLSIQKSNFILAHICICFLRLEEFQRRHSPLKLSEIDDLTLRYNFLEYSALSWTAHFREALIPEEHPLIAMGLELCDIQANQYLSWQLVYSKSYQGLMDTHPRTRMTNLHFASHFGLERVVARILTDPGINFNAKNSHMRTPLWEAVSQGHEVTTGQLLVLNNIDVNAADIFQRTPLWIASHEGHKEIVTQLLATPSVDVNLANIMAETPLWIASSKGYEEIVRQLLAVPSIGVNIADYKTRTPLWKASSGGHEGVVRQLLNFPSVSVNSADKEGRLPLHIALISGHETIADQLLAAPGLDVNKKNCEGETPLSLATHHSLGAVLTQLLARPDIEVNSKDSLGRTPLWYASDGGNAAMVCKLLADPRIDVNVCDDFGKSALSCARILGHEAVVRLLLAVPGVIDED